MKKIVSSIIRLTISYSKLIVTILFLSLGSTLVKADDVTTYLECGNQYLQLTGYYLKTNYNIRTKKFMESYKIFQYGEVLIYAEGYHLNRNTGEFAWGSNKKNICKKINFNQLPKLNAEGKKF